jgi:DNA sulfur modification protein DndD
MKYQKLKVHNVRSFYGTSDVEFSLDEKKPVTLIFGAHGSGKTTLITSIWWALYGTVNAANDQGVETLFNSRALAEIGPGSSAEAFVELELLVDGVVWRVTRTLEASKNKNLDVTYIEDVKLTKIIDDTPTHFQPQQIKGVIGQLIPAVLAEYIIHPAEQADVIFANNDSAQKKLRGAISNLTGQLWADTMRKQAKSAKDELRRKFTEAISRNDLAEDIAAKIQELEIKIFGYAKEIEEADANIVGLDGLISRSLDLLRAMEGLAEFVDELRSREEGLETAKDNLYRASEELRRGTNNLWKVQAQGMMKKFSHWFTEHGADFPLIVNDNLVLHMKRTGSCICGHAVSEKEIKAVEEHLIPEQEAGSTFITELYESARVWDEEAGEVKRTFESLRAKKVRAAQLVEGAERDLKDADEALNQAQRQFGNPGESKIEVVGARLEIDRAAKNNLEGRKKTLERFLKEAESDRAKLQAKGAAGGGDQVRIAEASYKLAEHFYELLCGEERIRTEYLRPKFQEFLNESYWVHKADRELRVKDDWAIVGVNKEGDGTEIEVVGGGAETALLAFAFAAAIARIIPAFPRGDGEATPQDIEMGTYPLAVDAPFSAIANTNYQKTIFTYLPDAVNQLILFTEATNLSRYEELYASGKVGEAYMVKYFGPLHEENLDDEAQDFEWRGRKYTYLENANSDCKSAVIERI